MKYIPADKLIAEIERINSLVSYESKDRHDEGLHDAYKAVKNVITSLQQEQPEVIGGIVHHALNNHWLITNQEQLNTRLKQFPEGAEVEILIESRKEE